MHAKYHATCALIQIYYQSGISTLQRLLWGLDLTIFVSGLVKSKCQVIMY